MALGLLHRGHRPQEVAQLVVVTVSTVYNWCRGWKAQGLEGWVNRPKSGRPRQADERYGRLLEAALETNPADSDDSFTIWTTD
jgi:transposase